jgi:hypothetical protein
MTLAELIRLARIRLRARNDQTLWTDDDLTEFANSAVEEACIRSRIYEGSAHIPITIGVESFTLPVPFYKLESAIFLKPTDRLMTAGNFVIGEWYIINSVGTTDFTLVGALENFIGTAFRATAIGSGTGEAFMCLPHDIKKLAQNEFYSIRNTIFSKASANGDLPLYYSRGANSSSINILPISNIAGVMVLYGRKLPSAYEKMVTPQDEPVIPIEFHRDLVHWMVAEAYNVHDSDALDPGAADKYEAKFEARFGKRPSARAEAQRLRGYVGGDIAPRRFGSVS